MNGIDADLLAVERRALATERARLAAAEDLLAVLNAELDAFMVTWGRFCAWVDDRANSHLASPDEKTQR